MQSSRGVSIGTQDGLDSNEWAQGGEDAMMPHLHQTAPSLPIRFSIRFRSDSKAASRHDD